MKRWVKVSLGVVVLLVGVVVAVGLLVDANTFRPQLETQLTTSLGRQVKLGNLSLSLLSGSLVADNLSIADDPAFGTAPSMAAKQLKIGVEMMPLITSHELHVRDFEAVNPEIHLVRAADGTWNFSSLGRAGAHAKSESQTTSLSGLTVGLISIKDGRAVVESLPAHGKPLVYEHLNATVNNFAFDKAFPFTMSAGLPAGGTLNLIGTAGPIHPQDAAMTPADLQLAIKHLDPVAAGFLDSESGIAMLADIDSHVVSTGVTATSKGTIHADRLVLLKGGSPAPKPIELTYEVSHTLKNNHGRVQDLALKTGNVATHLNGTYELGGDAPVVDLMLTGKSLPIDDLQALMPAVGVKLPNGSVLKGGTLTTTLAIRGSTKNSVISGPVEMNDTHLAGFNLGSKASGLAALGGVQTGDTTSIQTLKTDVHVTSAEVQAQNIYALLPALGEISGAGTVTGGGALNFKLTVKLDTAQGLGKSGVGLLSILNGGAGSGATAALKNGVPMTITGTTSNPIVAVDVKGVLEKNAGSIVNGQLLGKGQGQGQGQQTVDALTGLFGKKKK
jgi:AsmA protein